MKKTPMSREAASRIQSATAKKNSGMVPKGSFASRATSAAYKNEPQNNNTQIQTTNNSNSEEKSENSSALDLGVGIGLAALALGSIGFMAYSATKENQDSSEEKSKKSCCSRCVIM